MRVVYQRLLTKLDNRYILVVVLVVPRTGYGGGHSGGGGGHIRSQSHLMVPPPRAVQETEKVEYRARYLKSRVQTACSRGR